jgi:hypothetical protein
MSAGQFDKDFAYLMPFIDKISAAATGLPDPAARAELSSLIADEKQRWGRIRQLLSGASGKISQPSGPSARITNSETAETSVTRDRPSFTVGSLRTREH